MAGIVETITRSISIAARKDRPEVKISLQDEGGLALYTMSERYSALQAGFSSHYNSIVIAPEDVPGFSRWLASRVQPDATIWDRLAAHSAVKPEGV
jgi:hypothetical protein